MNAKGLASLDYIHDIQQHAASYATCMELYLSWTVDLRISWPGGDTPGMSGLLGFSIVLCPHRAWWKGMFTMEGRIGSS